MELESCAYLVVIVNYCTPQDVIDCLEALESEVTSVDALVAVVDNFSPDNSIDDIGSAIKARGWALWVKLIPADENGGFAYGNNLAIRAALKSDSPPRYIHLLNPDTVIEPGALTALNEFMDQNMSVGIAGSRQKIFEGEWNKSFRFPGLASEVDRGLQLGLFSKLVANRIVSRQMGRENSETEWVSGASMIVRREVFEEIGLMDEKYFLYYEEADFCLNAKRAGWPTWHVVDSVVFHKVGASTGVRSEGPKQRIPAYVYESRSYYFSKNYGFLFALLVDVAFVLAVCVQRSLSMLTMRDLKVIPFLLRDTLRHGIIFSPRKRKPKA